MQELIEQLVNYMKGVWLKKFYIIIAIWVICPIGWYFVWKMPDQFESKAQVYVDTQSLLRPLLRGLTVQADSDSQIRLIVRTLMTRPNLEKIARMADLDIQSTNPAEYEKNLGVLKDNLRIGSSPRENIFHLSYTSKAPDKAKDVVQAALDVFIENTLGETRGEADTAEQFLDRQIKEYETRLLEDERKLTEFKQANSALLGTNVGDFYGVLQGHKARLDEARLQLREVESRLASTKAQLKGEEPSFGLVQQRQQAFIATEYDGRIEQLRSQIDELSLKYTDRHPNIIELNRRLEELETLRDEEIKSRQEDGDAYDTGSDILDANPVYQQLKLTVSQLENEKASLQVRVSEYEHKANEIEEKIHLIPEIESQVISLNRGYEITKGKYNELLTRREQARLSQNADLTADDIQFKVVEPPRIPLEAAGPNRLLFMTVVVIFSFAVGLGCSLLISIIQPVAMSGSQLTTLTGYPVFGSVSLSDGAGTISKERSQTLIFFGAIAALIAIYAVLIIFQLQFGN